MGAQQRAPVPRGYVPGQTAGRSRGLPVHWPLCPAPLPPLVGGEGFAAAIGAAATESASVARTPAMTLRVLPIFLSFRSTFVRVDPCASNAPRDRPIAQGDLSHHAGAACGFASARCVGIQCDACRGGIAQRNRGSRNAKATHGENLRFTRRGMTQVPSYEGRPPDSRPEPQAAVPCAHSPPPPEAVADG